jgi:hypothetical protein
MNYLVSDLDIEDIKFIIPSYPKGAELDSFGFAEAIDILDTFSDAEEDEDKMSMLSALQLLKDHLHDATAGAVKITIFRELLNR